MCEPLGGKGVGISFVGVVVGGKGMRGGKGVIQMCVQGVYDHILRTYSTKNGKTEEACKYTYQNLMLRNPLLIHGI